MKRKNAEEPNGSATKRPLEEATSTSQRLQDFELVSLEDVQEAHKRIAPHTHYTPLITSQAIDALATAALLGPESKGSVRIAFKAEHLQRVGAFKYRGAMNAVLAHLAAAEANHIASGGHKSTFSPEKLVVVTHSSGNHAAALACAARTAGCTAAVVMPDNAPTPKKNAVAGYGARITFCKPTLEARESTARDVMQQYKKQGCVVQFVHPYDERLVIAGQGTMALEMLDQVHDLEQRGGCSHAAFATEPSGKTVGERMVPPEGLKAKGRWAARSQFRPAFDIIIAPVGGGGMLSGVSSVIKGIDDQIVVIGAEPDLVNDAFHSFRTKKIHLPPQPPKTICDGLLTSLSPLTLAHIDRNVDGISTVREENILKALQLHWERQKQFVEPSAAVGFGSVLQGHNEAAKESDRDPEYNRTLWGVKQWVQNRVSLWPARDTESGPEIRIGIIWSGGNAEVAKVIASLQEHGL